MNSDLMQTMTITMSPVTPVARSASFSWTRRRKVTQANNKLLRNCNFSCNSSCSFVIVFLVLFMLTQIVHNVTSTPIRRRSIPTSMQTYLLKFGYLPQSGFEIRDQVSENRMRQAIRELQAFANLTVTGEVDEPTLKLMQRPRCGVPDILSGQFRSRKKRFIVQGQKWPNTSLTWSLQKSTNSHRDEDVIRELTYALDLWARSSPLKFNRLPRDRANDADIRVIFLRGRHDDGYPFDGKGHILAHAFFPGSGQGGDAHFDDDEIWTVDDTLLSDGTRLFAVAAHEFGHSLGLSHSDVEGSLMYPWYQNFGYDFQLHRDDSLGIQRIYGYTDKFAQNPHIGNTPLRPPTKAPKERIPYNDGRPNTCDSSYDAISVIRNELFIFKGPYFWRLNDNQLLKGYPSLIRGMWRELPHNLTHVDAVYEQNDEIVFFIGKYYWRFGDGINLVPGFPKTLSSMGISSDVEKIDGAMIWGHNRRTYLFSGKKYWKLGEETRSFHVEPDYPRDMYIWKGVPYNIDAVFRWKDGHVYFFKGKVFWKFDDRHMRVVSETPSLSAPFFMGCTSHPVSPNEERVTSKTTISSWPVRSIYAMNLIVYSILSHVISL